MNFTSIIVSGCMVVGTAISPVLGKTKPANSPQVREKVHKLLPPRKQDICPPGTIYSETGGSCGCIQIPMS